MTYLDEVLLVISQVLKKVILMMLGWTPWKVALQEGYGNITPKGAITFRVQFL